MNAASLISMAAARGIDLQHVAGVASKLDGDAKERALTRDEKKRGLREVALTVKGKASRGYRRFDWSTAELGQAAQGLGQIPWNAALFSFAGARDGYWILWQALASEALRIAKRERWAPRVTAADGTERFFCEDLAELVLVHDANKHIFAAAPQLFSIYMRVDASVWDQSLEGPFKSLRDRYDSWLAIAQAEIRRWIVGE